MKYLLPGSLKIFLESPAGTISPLLTERPSDTNDQGFEKWSFLSVQMWGEHAAGQWILTIDSKGDGGSFYLLFLVSAFLANSRRKFSLVCL